MTKSYKRSNTFSSSGRKPRQKSLNLYKPTILTWRKTIPLSLLGIIIVLYLWELILVSDQPALNQTFFTTTTQVELLRQENTILQSQLDHETSYLYISSLAASMGFIPATKVSSLW